MDGYLAPSLISHGWVSGFTLAGCPGEGWLLLRQSLAVVDLRFMAGGFLITAVS